MKIGEYHKVTVILRGKKYETVQRICQAVSQAKYVKNLEITLNTPEALSIINKIKHEFGDRLNIGAGTVLTLEQAKEAVAHGAEFLLSPTVMGAEIIEFAKSKEVLTVSGAYTPTEVLLSAKRGCDIVKIFPVTSVAPTFFKDIKAPLGEIPLMAVGGVNQENGKRLLESGVDYLGAGGIFSKAALESNSVELLVNECQAFEKNVFQSNKGE